MFNIFQYFVEYWMYTILCTWQISRRGVIILGFGRKGWVGSLPIVFRYCTYSMYNNWRFKHERIIRDMVNLSLNNSIFSCYDLWEITSRLEVHIYRKPFGTFIRFITYFARSQITSVFMKWHRICWFFTYWAFISCIVSG